MTNLDLKLIGYAGMYIFHSSKIHCFEKKNRQTRKFKSTFFSMMFMEVSSTKTVRIIVGFVVQQASSSGPFQA